MELTSWLTVLGKQLLNTFSNFGGTWPKYFVMRSIDYFTVKQCSATQTACDGDDALAACTRLESRCETVHDGYVTTSAILLILGLIWLYVYIRPQITQLERVKGVHWRIKTVKAKRSSHVL